MADWISKNGHATFNILELGAGCGQFSYLCLHALKGDNFHYIMSDFNEQLINEWREHPQFKSYLDRGTLSLLQYDTADTLDNLPESNAPLIVIANYLFDSIPADIYAVSNGSIKPVHVTLSTNDANMQADQIIDFEQVNIEFEEQESINTDNPILKQYESELFNSKILYPTASIELIKSLQSASPAGVFLLASDKAYANIDELDHLSYPEIVSHSGCFSLNVNFDAIHKFAKLEQGTAYLPSTRPGLKSAAFSFRFSLDSFNHTKVLLRNYFEIFSPTDYLNIYRRVKKDMKSLSMEELTSYLALSRWDATLFQQIYQEIFSKLDGVDMLTIDYLTNHLPIIAGHWYALPDDPDLYFRVGVIFHALKQYAKALEFYKRSLGLFPDVFSVCFNMGVCAYHLGDLTQAQAHFKAAHQIDPENQKTTEWLSRFI